MRRSGGFFCMLAAAALLFSAGPACAQTRVTFPDSNLEAAVRDALGIPTTSLTAADSSH